MPRQPRYFVPGLPQHVLIRGVDRQATFRLLGETPAERRAADRPLVADALDRQVVDRIWDITNASQVLGNDQFIDQVEAMLGRRVR